jgi:hypothetical protein
MPAISRADAIQRNFAGCNFPEFSVGQVRFARKGVRVGRKVNGHPHLLRGSLLLGPESSTARSVHPSALLAAALQRSVPRPVTGTGKKKPETGKKELRSSKPCLTCSSGSGASRCVGNKPAPSPLQSQLRRAERADPTRPHQERCW